MSLSVSVFFKAFSGRWQSHNRDGSNGHQYQGHWGDCDPNEVKVAVHRAKRSMKEEVTATPLKSAKAIYMENVHKMPAAAQVAMSGFNSFKSRFSREKRKSIPRPPPSLVQFEFPDIYKQTDPDGDGNTREIFNDLDKTAGNSCFIMTGALELQELCNSEQVFLDGCFKVPCTEQVYTFGTVVEGKFFIPCVYAFLSAKTANVSFF